MPSLQRQPGNRKAEASSGAITGNQVVAVSCQDDDGQWAGHLRGKVARIQHLRAHSKHKLMEWHVPSELCNMASWYRVHILLREVHNLAMLQGLLAHDSTVDMPPPHHTFQKLLPMQKAGQAWSPK